MRSQLAKELRKTFDEQMTTRCSSFRKNQGVKLLAPGCVLYTGPVDPHLTLHLALDPHRRDDAFWVWAAWSEDGSLPATPGQLPGDAPTDGGLMFPIDRLWREPQEEDGWYLVRPPDILAPIEEWLKPPPSVETLIEPLHAAVADAVSHIETHVLPYFEKVAAARGVEWRG